LPSGLRDGIGGWEEIFAPIISAPRECARTAAMSRSRLKEVPVKPEAMSFWRRGNGRRLDCGVRRYFESELIQRESPAPNLQQELRVPRRETQSLPRLVWLLLPDTQTITNSPGGMQTFFDRFCEIVWRAFQQCGCFATGIKTIEIVGDKNRCRSSCGERSGGGAVKRRRKRKATLGLWWMRLQQCE
jgi:hypothetical protein